MVIELIVTLPLWVQLSYILLWVIVPQENPYHHLYFHEFIILQHNFLSLLHISCPFILENVAAANAILLLWLPLILFVSLATLEYLL